MKKNLLALSFALVFASTPSILQAESDSGAGKSKAVTCGGCHGENGNSTVAVYPKLAGQHVPYLVKQLAAFKDGSRQDAMMSGMAAGLSDEDMVVIAAYYAEQKNTANPPPVLPADEPAGEDGKPAHTIEEYLELGSDLYRNGDIQRGVTACIACHGPHGEGNRPAAFPTLESQHPEYLIKALTDYKTNVRGNKPDNMMHLIAKKMSNKEIKSVAYYISTLND